MGRGLVGRMELYRPLGRDAPDITSELCEAALGEASGRIAEALEILRSAQLRLDRQARDVVRRRAEAVEDRRRALERTGVAIALSMPPVEPAFERGGDAVADLVGTLLDAEQRIGRFEADWKGIQGIVAQIEGLRAEAVDLGISLGDVPGQIDALRKKLSSGPFQEADLDALAQDAARTLMLMHEALPTALEEELKRHGASIDALPADGAGRAGAHKLREETARHLAKGRLLEASQTLRDLRRTLADLQAGTPPAAPAAAGPPPDDVLLGVLLKKARSLAGRVRRLPADSTLSLEAAAQIREATELLRSGRLADADRTLTELMRMLSREEGGAA